LFAAAISPVASVKRYGLFERGQIYTKGVVDRDPAEVCVPIPRRATAFGIAM